MIEGQTYDLSTPVSVWKENDSIDGEEVEALVMILRTKGCSWASRTGCIMCGYNQTVYPDVTSEDLIHQVENALKRFNKEPYIKIFTSGSFLDPDEVPHTAQIGISKAIGSKAPSTRLLIESRPEFIDPERLHEISEKVERLEIAIGLETSSDKIRADNIRKGFTWNDYVNGGRSIIDYGYLLKTYLLMKPPLIGESDSIEDCISSIRAIHGEFPGSRISINPMNIQSQTIVETLYNRGFYRPPWLWSLMEVLRKGVEITRGASHLMSSPTAGGKKRGAHNCGLCDPEILEAIKKFSMTNVPDLLEGHYHSCKEDWEEQLKMSVSHSLEGT